MRYTSVRVAMPQARNELTEWLVSAAPGLAGWCARHADQLEDVLRARWDEARAAWPQFRVAPERWLGAVALGLDEASSPSVLHQLYAADLYLAQGCASGDRDALAAFEATCRNVIEGSLRGMGMTPDAIADVAQDVRGKLLVADDGPPKISTYSGRAALTTWTRTVATRTALARLRRRCEAPADDAMLEAIPAVSDGPEEQHFRTRYGVELKAAFEEAMASLDVRQRNILRHHYIDALTLDDIGALYGVHKTTAFRWLQAARGALAKRTQKAFRARVDVTPSEMQSIVRLLESNVELSLRRVLAI
jgi:RNA polymerase sigma-70 factor, ECF subfamily